MLGVLAVGLLPQLRNEQVGYLCHLVRVLHSTDDHLVLVALLLQVCCTPCQVSLTLCSRTALYMWICLGCCCTGHCCLVATSTGAYT